ncbi:MAG: hypothetical protein NTX64_18235 [Elusimicrobia bacterium]|nr:hypothetical protein [Elusimicrobiota bacterium]
MAVALLCWAAAAPAPPARASETAADVLRHGPGARPAGLGGAFVAVADDAHAAAWNPAGLSLIRRPSLSLDHFGFSGTSLESAGLAAPLGDGGFGAQLEWAHGTRSAFKAGAAASTPFLIDALHVGAGLSLARAAEGGRASETGLLDLGVLAAVIPGVNVAAAAQNVTGRLLGRRPPENLRFGTAVRFANTGYRTENDVVNDILARLLASAEVDYAPPTKHGAIALGAEYRQGPWAARLGLTGGPKDAAEGRHVSLGGGYKRGDWIFDVAVTPAKGYGDTFRAGVTKQFGIQPERPATEFLLRMQPQETEAPGVPGAVHLVERRFQRAEEDLYADRPKLALRELGHAREYLADDDPRLLRYFEARGRVFLRMKDWASARAEFFEGIQAARTQKARGEVLAHLCAGLGRALAEQGSRAEALRFLEASLKEGPAPERRAAIEELALKLKYSK